MSDFGPRIRRLFEEIAPPLDFDATGVRAEASPRPVWVPASAAVLGLVALTVAVAVLLSGPEDDGVAVSTTEPAASSTTSPTAPPVAESGGLVHFGEHGITIIPDDGGPFTLTSDLYFEAIGAVVPDGLDGIIFTHSVTPPPWPPGSIMWLAAGATEPVVFVPTDGLEAFEQLVPYSMVDTPAGPALVYLHWTHPNGVVKAQPLDPAADPIPLWTIADPASVHSVSSGRDRVLIEVWDPVCHLVLLDSTGVVVDSPLTAGPCDGSRRPYRLSEDGEEVWYAWRSPDSSGVGVVRVDASAPPLEIAIGGAWSLGFDGVGRGVVSTDRRHLVVTRTDDGLQVVPTDLVGGFVVPYRGVLAAPADATLGSGSSDFPCTDRTPPLPEQDLPAAVAETRRLIHAAVVACDWATIVELTEVDDSFIWDVAFSVPPLPYWVDAMRRGGDILGDIATVLTLPAGSAADGDGNITWVWPAVAELHDAATDADWQALLPLYPQEVIDRHRASEYGYVGLFALWIADDGTWVAAANLLP